MPVHVYTVLSEKHFSVISHIHFMSFEVDKKIGILVSRENGRGSKKTPPPIFAPTFKCISSSANNIIDFK